MSSNSKNERRRKFAARWHQLTASPNPLRTFAENVSQVARDAFSEASQLTVEQLSINLPRLPREFDGWRVVQLSDIHHSPFTDTAQIEESVRIANDLKPDIVVLTGDYVSHETEYIAPVAQMLGKLSAPHGVYAVLGNHDHWTDADMVTNCFRAENIEVLINQGFRFELGGAAVWLCGVDDTMVGLNDLTAALNGAEPDEFKFLLCHNPSILGEAEQRGVDFIVSGHTHGGQVRLHQKYEDLIMPRNRRRANSGLSEKNKTQIYISRGIGTVVLPVRYQCPPEISLLELKSV